MLVLKRFLCSQNAFLRNEHLGAPRQLYLSSKIFTRTFTKPCAAALVLKHHFALKAQPVRVENARFGFPRHSTA